MLQCLVDHGCVDLSSDMDPDQYSSGLIYGGGSGDIWKGKLYDGTVVAIKMWRFCSVPHNGSKDIKVCLTECLTFVALCSTTWLYFLARYARDLLLVKGNTSEHPGVNGSDHIPRATGYGVLMDGQWELAGVYS